jgi:hypothetical protein
MPLYTFKDKNKNIEYDKELSYEDLQEYVKQDHIEQVFKMNIFRYADGGGIKDQFTDWCKNQKVEAKGGFTPYGKATKDFVKKD